MPFQPGWVGGEDAVSLGEVGDERGDGLRAASAVQHERDGCGRVSGAQEFHVGGKRGGHGWS